MSDPVSPSEIEEVLSSIRRLISTDSHAGAKPAATAKTGPKPVEGGARLVLTPSHRVGEANAVTDIPPRRESAESLGLDSAVQPIRPRPSRPAPRRIIPNRPEDTGQDDAQPIPIPTFLSRNAPQPDAPRPDPLRPEPLRAEPLRPEARVEPKRVEQPQKETREPTLEDRIAELEAAVGQQFDDWEPDGSEYEASDYSFEDSLSDEEPLQSFTDESAAFRSARLELERATRDDDEDAGDGGEREQSRDLFTPSDLNMRDRRVPDDEIEDAEVVETAEVHPFIKPDRSAANAGNAPVANREAVQQIVSDVLAEAMAEVTRIHAKPAAEDLSQDAASAEDEAPSEASDDALWSDVAPQAERDIAAAEAEAAEATEESEWHVEAEPAEWTDAATPEEALTLGAEARVDGSDDDADDLDEDLAKLTAFVPGFVRARRPEPEETAASPEDETVAQGPLILQPAEQTEPLVLTGAAPVAAEDPAEAAEEELHDAEEEDDLEAALSSTDNAFDDDMFDGENLDDEDDTEVFAEPSIEEVLALERAAAQAYDAELSEREDDEEDIDDEEMDFEDEWADVSDEAHEAERPAGVEAESADANADEVTATAEDRQTEEEALSALDWDDDALLDADDEPEEALFDSAPAQAEPAEDTAEAVEEEVSGDPGDAAAAVAQDDADAPVVGAAEETWNEPADVWHDLYDHAAVEARDAPEPFADDTAGTEAEDAADAPEGAVLAEAEEDAILALDDTEAEAWSAQTDEDGNEDEDEDLSEISEESFAEADAAGWAEETLAEPGDALAEPEETPAEAEETLAEAEEPVADDEEDAVAEVEEPVADDEEDAVAEAGKSPAEEGDVEDAESDEAYAAAVAPIWRHAEPADAVARESTLTPEPEQAGALVAAQGGDVAVDDMPIIDEAALRGMVSEIVRSELQGELGERITRNVRKLVRREIYRALASRDFE